MSICRYLFSCECLFFIYLSTLFGIVSASGQFGWNLILIIISNSLVALVLIFSLAIIEAPVEVIYAGADTSNPIARGEISMKSARMLVIFSSVLPLVFMALIGWQVLLIELLFVTLVWLNSFKNKYATPLARFFYNGSILAVLPFLSGFFVFQTNRYNVWIIPIVLLFSFRIYIDSSKLIKQSPKQQSRPDMLPINLSPKQNQIIIFITLALTIVAGLVTFVFLDIIPLWVTVLNLVLFLIYLIPQFIHAQQTKNLLHVISPIHIPLVQSTAIALFMQLLIPWLLQFF